MPTYKREYIIAPTNGSLVPTSGSIEAYVAEIKGAAYDYPILPSQSLLGLHGRLETLESAGAPSGQEKQFGIAPEFANMVFDNTDIVDSNGTWLGGLDTSEAMMQSFLEWSTNVASLQSYKIRVMVKLPSDFGGWQNVAMRFWCKGLGVLSNIGLSVTVSDVNGLPTNILNLPVSFVANTWQAITVPLSSGTFIANNWLCLTFEAKANGIGNAVRIGRVDFQYLTA